MTDPAVVLGRAAQVAGQLLAAGEQAFHRRRVGAGILLDERVDPVLDGGDQVLDGGKAGSGRCFGIENWAMQ